MRGLQSDFTVRAQGRRKNLPAGMAPIIDRGHVYARSRLDIFLSVCFCEVGTVEVTLGPRSHREHPTANYLCQFSARARPSQPWSTVLAIETKSAMGS